MYRKYHISLPIALKKKASSVEGRPTSKKELQKTDYSSVSQSPGRGPVPDPGINYTGPREVLLEFAILVF
jgi:hypothetical protein